EYVSQIHRSEAAGYPGPRGDGNRVLLILLSGRGPHYTYRGFAESLHGIHRRRSKNHPGSNRGAYMVSHQEGATSNAGNSFQSPNRTPFLPSFPNHNSSAVRGAGLPAAYLENVILPVVLSVRREYS